MRSILISLLLLSSALAEEIHIPSGSTAIIEGPANIIINTPIFVPIGETEDERWLRERCLEGSLPIDSYECKLVGIENYADDYFPEEN